jgi:glycosyltransferase involved in cell wall biosynthesis
MNCWVHPLEASDALWIERTRRALRQAGFEPQTFESREQWIEQLRSAREPVLWMAAGSWRVQDGPLATIPSSATGRPLIALGAVRDGPGAEQWRKVLAGHGGDFDRRGLLSPRIPPPLSAWLAPEAAQQLGSRLAAGDDWPTAWRRLLAKREFRKVHLPMLDVRSWRGLRVLLVITSIQIGGAERVTLDLAYELNRLGVAVAVAALGRPTRTAFSEPAHFFDLAGAARDPESRASAIARAAREFGADLVHGHLLSAAEARAVRALGVPLVLTLHNMPAGWPVGVGDGGAPLADLILACSCAVAEQAREANLGAPIRTVWNGIDASAVVPQEPRESLRRKWREKLDWAEDDFVMVAIANPRRQKCLARLPAILASLQRRLGSRPTRLLLAGAPARGSEDAGQAASELDSAIAAYPRPESIRSIGAVHEIGEVLAASDALVSVSAFEGLSLAHLEALAAGLPVVATDAGGTREIAAQTTVLRLLSLDATDDEVAAKLAEVAAASPAPLPPFPASFKRHEMAARTHWFYPQVLLPRRSKGEGLWLVINNFSTGGAQSSARRLLLGLAARGVKVRAVVVEEHPKKPTPGRAALLAAGIPVLAVPPPGSLDGPLAVARVIEAIAADRPRAVLFWNVIQVLKILIADSLLDVPIFDVSPGEMYFHSLARYFANPRPALPYRNPQEYGARLAGVVVKYASEAEQAARTLGAPVHVIPNGVPLAPIVGRRSSPPRKSGLLVLGTAARLSPDKRLCDLLDAVRLAAPRLPRFVLRIAGGVERGAEDHARELRRAARGLPVEWCGELADTREFLAGLDLFVMISEPSGCPNASLEALAAGVPVVATDGGGAKEQIIDGVCGRLTSRRDNAALADAIVELAHDASKRTAFAEAGLAHLRERFSMDRMINRYIEVCGLEPATLSPQGERK